MKRIAKSVLGVTLLEIMLVLAIASMIIVMSVRYYQSATTSQQASAAVQQILAISTAMDSLGIGAGTYSGISNSQISAYLGGPSSMVSPTNGTVTVTQGTTPAIMYNVSMTLNPQLCNAVLARLKGNTKFTTLACTAAGVLTYVYNKTT